MFGLGAGHSGLMTAARLGMLGVEALIIDKQERSGDSWRTRYHDLVLHDPCWMNAMPYLPYPPSWPVSSSIKRKWGVGFKTDCGCWADSRFER